ncbi:MAG: autotransporter-associated beta strand repeat-containing protein [Planctomycetaceae bacterium]|jgi:autotransporter-associated beta strand protein|nr:autotransporter-associated beta strand repeat-containing protein [Planctomycetaceae bacterium]
MSRHSIRSFSATVLLVLFFGTAVSAQEVINYHVWDPAQVGAALPANSADNYYFPYLLLDPATPLQPDGVVDYLRYPTDYQNIPYPYWADFFDYYNAVPSSNPEHLSMVDSGAGPLPIRHGRPYRATLGWNLDKTQKGITYDTNLVLHNNDSSTKNRTYYYDGIGYNYYYDNPIYIYTLPVGGYVPRVTVKPDTPNAVREIRDGTASPQFIVKWDSNLTVNSGIQFIGNKNEGSLYFSNVIEVNGGELTVNNVVFQQNVNHSTYYQNDSRSSEVSYVGGGAINAARYRRYLGNVEYGFDFHEDEREVFYDDYYNGISGFYDNYQDYRSTIYVDGAEFDRNEANIGGAILLAHGDLTGNRTVFKANNAYNTSFLPSSYGGGAVLAKTQSTVRLENSTFTNNVAGFDDQQVSGAALRDSTNYTAHGGAIYAENSDVFVKGSNFRTNKATGAGGAVFFDSTDGRTHILELGAFAGTNTSFEGNLQEYDMQTKTGTANAVAFANTLNQNAGNIQVNVSVDGSNNSFNMFDPFAVAGIRSVNAAGAEVIADTNLILSIEKTGQGTWNLYGNSDLTRTKNSTGITIAEGTFLLGNGAVLNMGSAAGLDKITVAANAVSAIGDAGVPGTEVKIISTETKWSEGSELQLNNDFVFETKGKNSEISGTVSGKGGFIKDGTGTVTFKGKTDNYTGDLTVRNGEFVVNSPESFKTTGSVVFEDGTTLAVAANSIVPNIDAHNITLGSGVNIKIAGVAESEQHFVVLNSDNAITGNFAENPALPADVDYLTASFGFNPNRTKYEGTVALTWNKSNPSDGNGTFTVETGTDAPDYFKVNAVLEDITAGGKKLTKAGRGTLELAAANTYRGGTDVKQGTLLLTNAEATGDGAVNVDKNANLNLNFNGVYDNEISGAGQVVKVGDTSVKLTNVLNDYTGGTVIKEGTVSIGSAAVLGTGTITFDGGKLYTENKEQEIIISQYITSAGNNDAWLDTATDTTLGAASAMTGTGGLRKTGTAKLTLQGTGGYAGTTKLEEGTLSLANINSLGRGDVEMSGGTVFENTAAITNNRNIILNGGTGVIQTNKNWKQTGTVSGIGGLTKTGEAALTLTGSNSFSGGLTLTEGTVAFDSVKNLGTGGIIFDGGTLKNTAVISDLTLPMSMTGGNSIRLETEQNLAISSRLTGSGGLIKSGDAALLLSGTNDYRGDTVINDGKLYLDGTLTHSDVIVNDGATLGGTGTVYSNVQFNLGSSYTWYAGVREEDSPYLTVKGRVNLNGAVFTPVTSSAEANYPDIMDGWTVLKYGELDADKQFASVNNEWSPFYDFVLDYSTRGEVNVIGYHRRNPRALSDSVAMSIVMPQTMVHRKVFDQIDKELSGGRYLGLKPLRLRSEQQSEQTRGQAASSVDHLWGNLYERTTEYESTFHTLNPWKFSSFGVQVGYSFLSTNWLSMGITGGFEAPLLKNSYDKIELCDSYAGFYFGKRIYGMWELKGYLGVGYQDYKSTRNDTRYLYKAKYRGDTFETSIELGRPVLIGSTVWRGHFGFDLMYAGTQGAVENSESAEYRAYSSASLTRLYATVGIDAQQRYRRGDMFAGVAYSNRIGGQSMPEVSVFYPASKSGTRLYGTNLGQNVFTIRGGGNYYFDDQRSRSLFVNVNGDIYADRAGGQNEISTTVGYDYRF